MGDCVLVSWQNAFHDLYTQLSLLSRKGENVHSFFSLLTLPTRWQQSTTEQGEWAPWLERHIISAPLCGDAESGGRESTEFPALLPGLRLSWRSLRGSSPPSAPCADMKLLVLLTLGGLLLALQTGEITFSPLTTLSLSLSLSLSPVSHFYLLVFCSFFKLILNMFLATSKNVYLCF